MATKKEETVATQPKMGVTTKTFDSLIYEVKKKALEKKIVSISSNDTRDNNETSVITASCENQYFSVHKIVPLNTPVQIEQCLIDTLKDVKIPIHTPEFKNGKKTGNHQVMMISKYNISYEG